jgi:hypothetical protein
LKWLYNKRHEDIYLFEYYHFSVFEIARILTAAGIITNGCMCELEEGGYPAGCVAAVI